MRFLNNPSRVRRMLSGLLALTLALTNLSDIYAAGGSLQPEVLYLDHKIGIVNASFGMASSCSLTGWTAAGTIATVPMPERGDCKAVLSVDNTTVDRPAAASTRLEQSFVVRGNSAKLSIYGSVTSNAPSGTFAAQTITLYNKGGQIITQSTRNTQGEYVFGTYLNGYDGQTVKLSMGVNVDPTRADSPTQATMSVDFYMMYTGPEPEPPPGGGW
jgi:hypothetical protein